MLRVLSIVLVCFGSMCLCASNAGLTRDFGVKLCGREFIRAVIFTCGGSRWKRSGDSDAPQSSDGNTFLINSLGDLPDRDGGLDWSNDAAAAVERPNKPASYLARLLKALSGLNEYQSEPDLDLGETQQTSGWQRAQQMDGIFNVPWPRPNRRKRNFSLGLAGICCNQGCTKNDIGRLC